MAVEHVDRVEGIDVIVRALRRETEQCWIHRAANVARIAVADQAYFGLVVELSGLFGLFELF